MNFTNVYRWWPIQPLLIISLDELLKVGDDGALVVIDRVLLVQVRESVAGAALQDALLGRG